MKRTDDFRCPYCGAKNRIEVDTMIVETDGSAKNAILSERFCVHTCKKCNQDFQIQYPFAYINEMDKELIVINNDENVSAGDEFQFDNMHHFNGWRKRIVTNIEDVREKINIFSADLDDRVIELLKLGFVRSLKKRNPKQEICIQAVNVKISDDNRLTFIAYYNIDGNKNTAKKAMTSIEMSKYEEMLAETEEMLKNSADSSIIDMGWAIEFAINQ